MAETFLLVSEQSKHLCVEQLHINLWFLNQSKAFFDIGLLISLKKELLLNEDYFDIHCHPLFKMRRGSLQELYNDLTNEDILQIVFNDEVESVTNLGSASTPKDARLTCFKSGRRFLLLKPSLEEDSTDNKIRIEIALTNLNKETINNTFNGERVDAYLRFRYMVDIKKTSNILFDKRILNSQIHFDFRFNEPRLFKSNSYPYQNLIHTKNIFLFMIQPTYYRSRLQQDQKMKYIRLLEKEKWGEYIKDIEHEKGNFLVYYWQAKNLGEPPNNDFNMLVSIEAEKVDFSNQLITVLILILIAYSSLTFYQSITDQLTRFTPLIKTVLNIIVGGVILTVGGGLATNAIYDYVKIRIPQWFRNRQNSKRNK